jgi:hypothetical protein
LNDKFGAVDFSRPPSERHGVVLRDEIAANMEVMLPELPSLLADAIEDLYIVTRVFFTGVTNRAAAVVGNHAFNDFDGLLDALLVGDGRSAARVSRSLYEHLVNYCEVTSSPEAAERYLEHIAVTAELLGNLNRGLRYLKGAEYRDERRRLEKLKRDSLPRLRRAIATFGAKFRRDWSSRNLYDRAVAHGYGGHYDTYKLLSQVTHGSCGGVLGSYSEIVGQTVHRTGYSFDLAILSYLEGLTFFREFVKEICLRHPIEARKLVESVDRLVEYWPKYRRALIAIDAHVWPTSPPPMPIAVMALYSNGRIRWFFWEPILNKMKAADSPPGCEKMEERFRKYVEDGNVEIPPNLGGRPITSAVSGVQVSPKEGAAWFAADAILAPGVKPSVSWLKSA